MKYMKHWQDPINVLLGAWLAVSPWVLGFQDQMAPTANGVVIGLALIAAALAVWATGAGRTLAPGGGALRAPGA